jgi:hypothetical protein
MASQGFQNGLSGWDQCRDGASLPSVYGNGELWGWDELRGGIPSAADHECVLHRGLQE